MASGMTISEKVRERRQAKQLKPDSVASDIFGSAEYHFRRFCSSLCNSVSSVVNQFVKFRFEWTQTIEFTGYEWMKVP